MGEGNGYCANFRRFEIKYARVPMHEKYTADYTYVYEKKREKKKSFIMDGVNWLFGSDIVST